MIHTHCHCVGHGDTLSKTVFNTDLFDENNNFGLYVSHGDCEDV